MRLLEEALEYEVKEEVLEYEVKEVFGEFFIPPPLPRLFISESSFTRRITAQVARLFLP